MSVFLLRFPSPFISGRHFLGNLNPYARILEFRIAVSPAIISLKGGIAVDRTYIAIDLKSFYASVLSRLNVPLISAPLIPQGP